MRFTLHMRSGRLLHITASHLKQIEDSIQTGQRIVAFEFLNDENGKMHTAVIPTESVDHIVGAGGTPTYNGLEYYRGEARCAELGDGKRFIGILDRTGSGHWTLTWRERKYLLPIGKLTALRGLGSLEADHVNTGPSAAAMQCCESPELREARASAIEAGRGTNLLVIVKTFNARSEAELSIGIAMYYGAGTRILDQALNALLYEEEGSVKEPETVVSATLEGALGSPASRAYWIASDTREDYEIAAAKAVAAGREVRIVEPVGSPAARPSGVGHGSSFKV